MTTGTRTVSAVGSRWFTPIAAMLIGVACVAIWHWVGHERIYRFGTDSASYLEMAQSLREVGEPLVVSWGPEVSDTDATAQIYFPPGYSILISAAMTLWPDARSASLAGGPVAFRIGRHVLGSSRKPRFVQQRLVAIPVAGRCPMSVPLCNCARRLARIDSGLWSVANAPARRGSPSRPSRAARRAPGRHRPSQHVHQKPDSHRGPR
jgi:hypothetical protein